MIIKPVLKTILFMKITDLILAISLSTFKRVIFLSPILIKRLTALTEKLELEAVFYN